MGVEKLQGRSICIDENDCKVCLCIYFIKNEAEENLQKRELTHTHTHTYNKKDDTDRDDG